MGIVIGPIEFEGPYSDAMQLKDAPGIYAILSEERGELELVELDEHNSLNRCLDVDEFTSNMRFWQENCRGNLLAAVHYTPNLDREARQHMKMRLLEEYSD